MNTGTQKHYHPRIPLKWPVILMTPKDSIKGEISNISGGCALILYSETLEIDDEFKITLKLPANHKMLLSCEKMWTDSIIADESIYNGIGVRFTKISSSDLYIIDSLVGEYYGI